MIRLTRLIWGPLHAASEVHMHNNIIITFKLHIRPYKIIISILVSCPRPPAFCMEVRIYLHYSSVKQVTCYMMTSIITPYMANTYY